MAAVQAPHSTARVQKKFDTAAIHEQTVTVIQFSYLYTAAAAAIMVIFTLV